MLRLFPRKDIASSLKLARGITTKQLVYEEYGDPAKVVHLEEVALGSIPDAGRIRVQWKGAPINPADLNQIQGVYPVKPALPAVGGNEGFGVVTDVGAGVTHVKKGDHVIPARAGQGTWRKWGDHPQKSLFKIDPRMSLEASATLQVNPSTAYRMLKDFVALERGDTVVQNGSNSGVGRAVMQMCRILELNCVSVVRARPDINILKAELISLGSSQVVTEEELASNLRGKVKARLALNCVGGRSSLMLAAALAKGGVMVTYGGMSRQPLSIPTASLIFSDIKLAGFWMSRWYDQSENEEARDKMYKELADWFVQGKMLPQPMEKIPLEDGVQAIQKAATSGKKILLV